MRVFSSTSQPFSSQKLLSLRDMAQILAITVSDEAATQDIIQQVKTKLVNSGTLRTHHFKETLYHYLKTPVLTQ